MKLTYVNLTKKENNWPTPWKQPEATNYNAWPTRSYKHYSQPPTFNYHLLFDILETSFNGVMLIQPDTFHVWGIPQGQFQSQA